jgi:protein TonB
MALPEQPKLEAPPVLATAAPKPPDVVPQTPSPEEALNPGKKPPQPVVTVSWDVAPESGLRHLASKIPWLNRLPGYSRGGSRFTPAQPVRRIIPVIPYQLMHDPPGLGPVDVRVRIDDWGHVGEVELLSGHNDFAHLASRAAERWRFLPARLDGRPVDCEMVLHFRLQPPLDRDDNDLAVRK